jgi:hypothetical protein
MACGGRHQWEIPAYSEWIACYCKAGHFPCEHYHDQSRCGPVVAGQSAFCQELVTLLNGWHLEMITSSPFTLTEVWHFCVHILEAIFKRLRTARGVIQDAAEQDPSLLIWGMLKAHAVLARLTENDFRSNPVITGLMMRMLMTHGPHASLQTNLHKQEAQVESNKANCTNLKMIVQNLENKAR